MGIATGFCSVGNFGSEDRLDYTIVGSPVNLASRLEGAAETGAILLSRETYLLVNDLTECRDLGERDVEGMAYPVPTYELIRLLDQTEKAEAMIEQDHEGFHLLVDLNAANHNAVVESLRDALSRLEESES